MCISKVAFEIAGTQIYWYGIIMCFSIIAAILVASFLSKKKNINTEIPLNIAMVIIPFGIIFARLFACLFDDSLSIQNFFNFRTGGMSIIGAIVGGGCALLIYCLLKKEKKLFIYFDILCTVLILAQSIGRWGNFFNQELYGAVVSEGSFFARFPFAVFIDETQSFHQALFFYESIANLIGFIILAIVFLKSKRDGYSTSLYLIIYGLIRTILEPMRQQEYILKLGIIPISQVLSFVMLISGVAILILLKVKDIRRIKNGKKN